MKKQKTYFQFPLILLKDVHENYEDGMENIIVYSIVDFALKQKITIKDAARQTCYDKFCKNEILISFNRRFKILYKNSDLEKSIEATSSDEISNSVSVNDFFTSDETRESIVKVMIEVLKENKGLLDAAIEHTQLTKINSFFNIAGPGPNDRLKKYESIKKRILSHEEKYGEDPRPTLDRDLYFVFRRTYKDPLLFGTYIAIKSLIGRNSYTRTNKEAIATRMFGAKTKEILKNYNESRKFNAINKKIFKSEKSLRYWIDKQIDRLQELDLVKKISWGRGLYLTTSLSYDKLAEMITKEKKLQEHKQKEKEAIKQIRAAL
jgi:hypothetical protein